MTTRHSGGIKGAGWTNVVVGALILLTPFGTGDTQVSILWSSVLSGALVAILAGSNIAAARRRHTERAYGPAILNVLLGVWVLVSGFALAASATYTGLNVVYGLVLVAAAGYNSWAAADARRLERPIT